jgi:hypothetical protein
MKTLWDNIATCIDGRINIAAVECAGRKKYWLRECTGLLRAA